MQNTSQGNCSVSANFGSEGNSRNQFSRSHARGARQGADIYDLGDRLLIVATDRLSAFDVVMPTPIPDKGRVLTQLSLFWFNLLRDVIPHHVLSFDGIPSPVRQIQGRPGGRTMLVRKTNPCRSSASRGISIRLRLEGVRRLGKDLRHFPAGRLAGVRQAPRADIHARDKSGYRPR